MKSHSIFIAILLFASIAVSCKKDKDNPTNGGNPTPTTNSPDNLSKNYIDGIRQYFTVDASTPQTIVGNQGTKIFLSGTNFTDGSGNPLSGNVTVELVEIYKKSAMVTGNKVTLGSIGSNAGILVSGGEFYLSFKQNGSLVNVVQAVTVRTQDVAVPDFNMALFEGEENANGDILWTETTDSLMIIDPIQGAGGYYQFLFGESFGWINCDYFYNNPATPTNVTINLPTECTGTNTNAFMVFTTINAVTSMPMYTINSFNLGSYYTVPIGTQVRFVVVSEIGGQLKYAVTDNTAITLNHVETVTTLTNVSSMSALESLLDGIF